MDEQPLKERETIIVDEYGGIFPVYEAFYIHSIIYAADRSESAFGRFDCAVLKDGEDALIVATVQEALTHAGALSRFFWPMKKTPLSTARGKRLRDAFTLDDASPLKARGLRNAFEHFDEDLDAYFLHDRVGYLIPGPRVGDYALASQDLDNVFRLVDPKQGKCVLLGKTFEFLPVRQEVRRVLSRALEMDAGGSRL